MKIFKFASLISIIILCACKRSEDPKPTPSLTFEDLQIQVEKKQIKQGDSLLIKVLYTNSSGEKKYVDAQLQHNNPPIADIRNSFLKANGSGMLQIKAIYQTLADSVSITILTNQTDTAKLDSIPHKILIWAPSQSLVVGQSIQLHHQVLNKSDEIIVKSPTWVSSDTTKLKINALGQATALQSGVVDVIGSIGTIQSLQLNLQISETSKKGSFNSANNYTTSGDVIVSKTSNGLLQIELSDNFRTSVGPDVLIYLANIPEGAAINNQGLLVSKLNAFAGNQLYYASLPSSTSEYAYIVIQCRQFARTFGYAKIE